MSSSLVEEDLFSGVGKGRRTREGPPGVFAFRQHPKDARASGQELKPALSDREISRETAKRLYCSDKAAQQL